MTYRYPSFELPIGSHGHFAAMSGNVRQTQTYLHLDEMNKANGICPIFNTSNFDPVKGSYLILQQLSIVVEFPLGTVMLISSATLVHDNVAIQEHEKLGGLFRIEKDLKTNYPDKWTAELKDRKERWTRAVVQYSTLHTLINDRKNTLFQINNDLRGLMKRRKESFQCATTHFEQMCNAPVPDNKLSIQKITKK
ncbi:hypothetical protein BDY19DRAFT_903639 [Irpex rosettiformis]|uniref:Uncharacterized protein n=2 Tax=Irpex rosettiformis TaxID=378272 RepID=A0ACB8TTM3_9APHY|nr:hypothetical protein BDY19DRAFT_909013 [Irpex rosettiformis]KAI0092918.1 hypothetical protein BDY19DRAFT_903639 [Irpex rosettiformis]